MAPIETEGVMHKKGGIRTNWLKRYFILSDGALCYYPSADVKIAKGFVLTRDILAVRKANQGSAIGGKSVGSKAGFEALAIAVETKKRTYYFAPETPADVDHWISALTSWLGHNPAPTAKEDMTAEVSKRRATAAPPNAALVEAASVRATEALQDSEAAGFSLYQAEFSYEAKEDNELSFEEGDVIRVLDQFDGAGWWKAEVYGKPGLGLVPGVFLKELEGQPPAE
jgi:hypothetical protein